MWFDPMLELKPYGYYPERDLLNANSRGLMQEYKASLLGPISWREWLRLLAGLVTVFMMLLVKREDYQVQVSASQDDRLTLEELLSYPLHQPGQNDHHFSLN